MSLKKLYFPLDAEETLSGFMVNDWPDETLFEQTITELFKNAGYGKNKVRAFGEMVAILWAKGLHGATVQLEQLWNKFHEKNNFSLFCAYPKSGFDDSLDSSLSHICKAHSKMISGLGHQLAGEFLEEINYTRSH